ncbi:hypothetical protein CDAR_444171 [Caerostris darwini]|uniref:Uncharacterized protein n=1 Tax=Caerostris darwini TaxID=1538125 RepID=A0AAV4X988_9ARAC|nr:hypothetical protein CDAR_444171 [Caerostris darwini]
MRNVLRYNQLFKRKEKLPAALLSSEVMQARMASFEMLRSSSISKSASFSNNEAWTKYFYLKMLRVWMELKCKSSITLSSTIPLQILCKGAHFPAAFDVLGLIKTFH